MTAQSLLKKIVNSPEKLGLNERRATKLNRCLARISQNRNEALRQAIKVGTERVSLAGPSIYIANIGSSGSHWLQELISDVYPTLPCGEVYIPDRVLRLIGELDAHERSVFVQTYYAIHGWSDSNHLVKGSAINTAHIANPRKMADHEKDARLLLLLRDPLDIVISRTFRKQEYRNAIGHGDTSDEDYLQINISFVKEFYESVEREAFDTEIRYEEIKSDQITTLRKLSSTIGVVIDEQFNGSNNKEFDGAGEKRPPGNLYSGPKVHTPEHLVNKAEFALKEIRREYGYL